MTFVFLEKVQWIMWRIGGKLNFLSAAYSADDGRDFIDELIHWVDNSFFDKFLMLFNRLGYQEFTSALYGIKMRLCRVNSENRFAEYVV